MDIKEELPTKKRGRPKGSGKINDALIDSICKGIANGLTYEGACSLAGIDPTTFRVWRKLSTEATSGIYSIFSIKLEKAELDARNLIENALYKCALGYEVVKKREVLDKEGNIVTLKETYREMDTATLRFVAERRYAKDWGRKDKLDLSTGDKALTVSLFGNVGFGTGNSEEQ